MEPSSIGMPYFTEHSPIVILSDAEFAGQSWEGNGSSINPYIIERLNITVENQVCILIWNVTAHFIIRNSYLSTAGEFADNIQIVGSRNGVVDNCTITGGRYGVEIRTSTEITVANCTIYGTASMGITLTSSDACFISSNLVYGTNRGIRFWNSANGAVIGNKVYRAEEGGISMYFGTADNRIFYNFIGWNGPDGFTDRAFNAADNGDNNVWDDNISLGNFWWGYEGEETYNIGGAGDAFDRFPYYFNDTQAPIIVNRAEDMGYELDDGTSYIINWTAWDSHPYRYEITRGERVIESDIWHLQNISLNVGGLNEGIYNFTIHFIDGSGNRNTDTLMVYVIHYVLGDIGTDLVGYASILTIFVVMSLLILARKVR
jgi:parallel beta-helix repeat protein